RRETADRHDQRDQRQAGTSDRVRDHRHLRQTSGRAWRRRAAGQGQRPGVGLSVGCARETGVHTAVIGHTGKNVARGERGSNAALGDADAVFGVDGDGPVKTVTVTDANDLAEGELFSFTGKKYSFGVDEDGDEDSVYIVGADEPAKAAPTESETV